MTREEEAKSYLDVMGYTETAKERVHYDAVVTLMLAFADAEAAAMRERAAAVPRQISGIIGAHYGSSIDSALCEVEAAIRALPATAEVGRG